jgi:glycosyltransferase involved in cell wall biosynthesis
MYGIDAINISGALDESIFSYSPNKIEKFNHYKNKILTIARLDENKRIDELIMAFSIFLKKNPDSILIIGGTGEEHQNLSDLITELEIEKNIKLVGFIPDDQLYDYYSWADLFVSIDWADFRITSYEAMVMCTKVLLSDETDTDSILINTGYYYLTEPNRNAVASNIERALINIKILPKNELLTILRNYSWGKYFSKMEKIVNA